MRLINASSSVAPQNLLLHAQCGDRSQLGSLLDAYRNYLNLVADTQLDQKLRGRISPSDIVQETMLAAHRDFQQFRGQSDLEFKAWLRKILTNTLARAIETHVLTQKRDVRRDVSLKQIARSNDRSGMQRHIDLAARGNTPSSDAQRRERASNLSAAMAELPADHREVLLMRNMRGLKFREIAEQLDRSIPATKMLWMRAIKRLRELCEDRDVG